MIDFLFSNNMNENLNLYSNNYKTRIINSESYVSNKVQKIIIIFDDNNKLPTKINR